MNTQKECEDSFWRRQKKTQNILNSLYTAGTIFIHLNTHEHRRHRAEISESSHSILILSETSEYERAMIHRHRQYNAFHFLKLFLRLNRSLCHVNCDDSTIDATSFQATMRQMQKEHTKRHTKRRRITT